jgi:hypothetical protein
MEITKDNLEKIAITLANSRDFLAKEATLIERNGERPLTVSYFRKELIPEIDKAYSIIISAYNS